MARDIGMNRPTVWSIMHRIRAAMALDPKQKALFHGIVEADETYIGGRPRKKIESGIGLIILVGAALPRRQLLGFWSEGGEFKHESLTI